jgi:hypothetical protein
MLYTCEMRWFFRGVPLELARHFDETTLPESRTDWYTVPCDSRCGIKLRQGRLEVKLRAATHGTRTFQEISGHLESWQKWSLEFPPAEIPPEDLLEQAGWLPVQKQRYLRHFEVADDQVVEIDVRPCNGCEFEMTQLLVKQQHWWTVGFEAVGLVHQLETNLSEVVRHILSQGRPLLPFVTDSSFGYAHWLGQVSTQF